MNSVDRVAEGAAALARGDWSGAREHFEASLGREETTAALEGLSDALFWLEEVGPSIERRTRACLLYQEAGDACRAARAALWLAMSYFSALGNGAAGNGWLQRAERLLEDAGPCAERGWLVQLRGKMTPDAATAVDQREKPSGSRGGTAESGSGGVGPVRAGARARLTGGRGCRHGDAR